MAPLLLLFAGLFAPPITALGPDWVPRLALDLGGLEAQAGGSRPEPFFSFHPHGAGGAAVGGAARRALIEGEPPAPPPPGVSDGDDESAVVHHAFEGGDAHGGWVSFSSSSAVRREVVALDALPFVLAAACREGGLALALEGAGGEAAAADWAPGTLLVGGPQWGCDGAPFYLRVTKGGSVRAKRGAFVFHGSADVLAVDFEVEPVPMGAAFDHLSFQVSRASAAGGDAGHAAVPVEGGQEGGVPASVWAARRAAAVGGSVTSPLYQALRWGTAAPGRTEAAVTWNVRNGSSGNVFGPAVLNPRVTLAAPYGGHYAVCAGCYAWSSVDVKVGALFEGRVAREVEVTASVKTSARFVFDILVNETVQHVVVRDPYNVTIIDPVDGVTKNVTRYTEKDLGVINTGNWTVPLLGVGAAEWLGGIITDPLDPSILIFTLSFSIQGVPLAVPVRVKLALQLEAFFNTTGSAPQTTAVQNAGLSVSGTTVVGSRYTADAGWHAVRSARALSLQPSLPLYDLPASANPSQGLQLNTSLLTEVKATLFGDWAFTSSAKATSALYVRPRCWSQAAGFTYDNSTVPAPQSLNNSVFATLSKRATGWSTVGDPQAPVLVGPACMGVGVGCNAARQGGLQFPLPSANNSDDDSMQYALRDSLPRMLGPFALLREESVPATAYSTGCVPNYGAVSLILVNQTRVCVDRTSPCNYEVDPFESDPDAASSQCGSGLLDYVGWKYRRVRCRYAGPGGFHLLVNNSVCDRIKGVLPNNIRGGPAPYTYVPRRKNQYCGTAVIFPDQLNSVDRTDANSACENLDRTTTTNASLVNFSMPLFASPRCRWLPQLGQWGIAECGEPEPLLQPTASTTPTFTFKVCGDASCTNCIGIQSADLSTQTCLKGASFSPPTSPPWPFSRGTTARVLCGDNAFSSQLQKRVPLVLDGGLTATRTFGTLQQQRFSLSIDGANTVAFIITYSGQWPTGPSVASADPLPSTSFAGFVSFDPLCYGNPATPSVGPDCAAPSSTVPIEASLPGATGESNCPAEAVHEVDPSILSIDPNFGPNLPSGSLPVIQKTSGCLCKIITLPVGQMAPWVSGTAERNGQPRAYLTLTTVGANPPQAFMVQGVAWTRGSSSEPLLAVHPARPLGQNFFSYRPAPGVAGIVVFATQMGGPNGAAPSALLMTRAYTMGQRMSWPKRWDVGSEGTALGLPMVVDARMIPTAREDRNRSLTLVIVRLAAYDMELTTTDSSSVSGAEQLITLASLTQSVFNFVVQAFDLSVSYPGVPISHSLLSQGRAAYIVTPAETGANALNITLWLQPGGSAVACVAAGVGSFDFSACTTSSLARRVQQLTIREGHPAWAPGGMTVTVLASSESFFTLTNTPYVALEPGQPGTATLPPYGAAMFGGVPDGRFAVNEFRSAPGTGGAMYADRGSYVAQVSHRVAGEVNVFAGASSAYQRLPPGPSGFDQVLRNAPPELTSFGGLYSPPLVTPPVLFSAYGSIAAVTSAMGESGPETNDDAQGVPGNGAGRDPSGTLADPLMQFPQGSPGVPGPASRGFGDGLTSPVRRGRALTALVQEHAAAMAPKQHSAAPLSAGTARARARALGTAALLAPGASPLRLFSWSRATAPGVGGAWIELFTSGAACAYLNPFADSDSWAFASFSVSSCAGNLTIPGDGGSREFMVGLPAATALRAQARAGTQGGRNLVLCSDQNVLGGGVLGGGGPWCTAPAIGPAPYLDYTACGNPSNPPNTTGGGALRYVRFSLRLDDDSKQAVMGNAPTLSYSRVALVLAASYAGVDACPTYTWSVGNWNGCDQRCTPGFHYRPVMCVDSRGVAVAGSLCPLPAPEARKGCNDGPCVQVAGPWGECSVTCRTQLDLVTTGVRHRSIACRQKGGFGDLVPDAYCGMVMVPWGFSGLWSPENAPRDQGIASYETCIPPLCPETGFYSYGPWGPCSSSCGGGTQSRIATCNPGVSTSGVINSKTYTEDQWCDALGLVADETQRPCNLFPCAFPEITLTYADVRALDSNTSVTQLVVPGGGARFFTIPLPINREPGLGICINVKSFSDYGGFGAATKPTCSERALSQLGTCTATLSTCLSDAPVPQSPVSNIYGAYGLGPGRRIPGVVSADGDSDPVTVCGCYATAQACLAEWACAPLPWQVLFIQNTSNTVNTQCLYSTCMLAANDTLKALSCAPGTGRSRRPTASAISIFASFQTFAGPGTTPSLSGPVGHLPASRSSADLFAIPSNLQAWPIQGMHIAFSEVPANAYGVVFSVAAPLAGFTGVLNATVMYPNYNTTEIWQAHVMGAVPPPQPQPVMVFGNFSTGATYNFTKYKVSAPWLNPQFNTLPNLGPGDKWPPIYNFTSEIPTFSWNDTNLRNGGLVMVVNLSCGAFVDPAATPSDGTLRGGAIWGKNALLQGIRARFPLSSGFTTGVARNGWESIRSWFVSPGAPPAVWYDHLGTSATVILPPLFNTSYAPKEDEELTFTIPGALLTSGRDTPVPMFHIRINTTQLNWDCKVGVWAAWTGCSVGIPQVWPVATCGEGVQQRARPVLQPAMGMGLPCPALVQRRACNSCNPCAKVKCVNGGLCVGGGCVCPPGYGGEDCSQPPANPLTCRAWQKTSWTSCGRVTLDAGWRNRTIDCVCYDGSLAAAGLAGPGVPLAVVPTATATPTPDPARLPPSGTQSNTPTPASTASDTATATVSLTESTSDTPSVSPSNFTTPTQTPPSTPSPSVTVTPSPAGVSLSSTPSLSGTGTGTMSPTVRRPHQPLPPSFQTTLSPSLPSPLPLSQGSDSRTPSQTPSWSTSLSSSQTPCGRNGQGANNAPCIPSPGGLDSQSQTPTTSPSTPPSYNLTNYTWAPVSCGTLPVPAWRAPCPLGSLNVSVVQVFLPMPTLVAANLLMHANVWDAWSSAVGQQLADWVRIPSTQLYVVGAETCPPPPSWLGPGLFSAWATLSKVFEVDCLVVEFVEDPGALVGAGLSSMAALYRIAAAIGAVMSPGRMGDYEVRPLPATGINPLTYLLSPLWTQSPDVGNVDLLSLATWNFIQYPRGTWAPTLVPGAPRPGRFSGRLKDLGGIVPAPGAIYQPWFVDAWDLIKSLAAFVALFAVGAAGFFVYRRYAQPVAPRYHRVRRNSVAATLPKPPAPAAGSSPRRVAGDAVGEAAAAPPSPGLQSLIALNPLNILGGLGGGSRKRLAGAPKASSWTSGWMRSGAAPSVVVEEEDVVVGVNPLSNAMAGAALELPPTKAPSPKTAPTQHFEEEEEGGRSV